MLTSIRSRVTSVTLFLLLLTPSCATPSTQYGSLSPESLQAEQMRQRQLVVLSSLREQERMHRIAAPVLRAASPLCGDRVVADGGLIVANVHTWDRQYHTAARSLGFSDTLQVVAVAPGSAAQRGGVMPGDRLLSVNGLAVPSGRTAATKYAELLAPPRSRASSRSAPVLRAMLQFVVVDSSERGDPLRAARNITVAADTACAFGAVVQKHDALNAWADGERIIVTSAMMRFASADDELAVVVAHEVAHNAMRHVDAMKSNAGLGALLGAIVDIAAATQGVNTGGDFTNLGAAAGASAYSQDFEREADYVGMYILARAGFPVDSAPNFWRRMAEESPGSIGYASSHPTTAERFIRLEQALTEIRLKQDAGLDLLPELTRAPDK